MELVPVQDTEKDFEKFLRLEEDFSRHYTALGVGKQYDRMAFEEEPIENHREEFKSLLVDHSPSLFLFANEGDSCVAYVAGYIESLPSTYRMRKIGYLDSIIVANAWRGHGIGRKLMMTFENWCCSKGVTHCQLHAKIENKGAIRLYEELGFKIDEVRMWKEI